MGGGWTQGLGFNTADVMANHREVGGGGREEFSSNFEFKCRPNNLCQMHRLISYRQPNQKIWVMDPRSNGLRFNSP